MNCKYCGAEIGAFDSNCSVCGASVNDTTTGQSANQQPTNQQPAYTQPTYPQGGYQQPTYPQGGYQQPVYPQDGYQPTGYQQPYQPTGAPMQAVPADPGKGLGIASMVLGIVGFVFCCCLGGFTFGVTTLIAPFCLIIGLILGIVGKSKSKTVGAKNAPAIAGIVLSAIPLALGLIAVLVIALFGSTILAMLLPYLEEFGLDEVLYMFEDVLGGSGIYF